MTQITVQAEHMTYDEGTGAWAVKIAAADRGSFRPVLCALVGRPFRLTVSRWYRKRSTGPGSACNHLHGHLTQLGRYLGYHMEDMKALMKADCIDWPRKQVKVGGRAAMVPISESEATTVAEAAGIEWTHMRAAEVGCQLVEDSDAAV